jgi:hypothetical protein
MKTPNAWFVVGPFAATFFAIILDYQYIGPHVFGWLTWVPAIALVLGGGWLVLAGITQALQARKKRPTGTLVVVPPAAFLALAGWRLPAVSPLVVERLALAGLVAVIFVVVLACLLSLRRPASARTYEPLA